jgi:hypothetical protein
MPRALLIAHRQNATIEELKQVSRLDSNETATRCMAIQMLLAGAARQLVCNALLVTNRALTKWINRLNQCGVDGLIVKKRPGTMTIIQDQQTPQLVQLIHEPQQPSEAFGLPKPFMAISANSIRSNAAWSARAQESFSPLRHRIWTRLPIRHF